MQEFMERSVLHHRSFRSVSESHISGYHFTSVHQISPFSDSWPGCSEVYPILSDALLRSGNLVSLINKVLSPGDTLDLLHPTPGLNIRLLWTLCDSAWKAPQHPLQTNSTSNCALQTSCTVCVLICESL